jgi:hypothetical protein
LASCDSQFSSTANQDRDLLDAGLLRRAQASLSVDQDEVPVLAHHGKGRRGDPGL